MFLSFRLFAIWGARSPSGNTTFYNEVVSKGITAVGMDGAERSAGVQGGMQLVAMVVTLVVAIVGGAITG